MGCDIHLFTEVKIDGVWHCHAKCDVNRDYTLFSKMAGVRSRDFDSNPISQPKGLPADTSVVVTTYAEYWLGDTHSHSWLNGNEILELERFVEGRIEELRNGDLRSPYNYAEKIWGYLFGNSWGGFIGENSGYSESIEDIRFVFWFDC